MQARNNKNQNNLRVVKGQLPKEDPRQLQKDLSYSFKDPEFVKLYKEARSLDLPEDQEKLNLLAENFRLLKVIEDRNRELQNADRIIQRQENIIAQTEKMLLQYADKATKTMTVLVNLVTSFSEDNIKYKRQIDAMVKGEEWKPTVQAIIQANRTPVSLN